MALRLMGFTKEDICIHGLRGTASTLLNEQRRWDSELLEERRNMMQAWADYLETTQNHPPPSNYILKSSSIKDIPKRVV